MNTSSISTAQQIYDSSKILPDLLGEVILEQEGQTVFDSIEILRKGFIQQRIKPNIKDHQKLIDTIKQFDLDTLDRVIHAFSTFFHLTNIGEEQYNHIRRLKLEENKQSWNNSFLETIKEFKNN